LTLTTHGELEHRQVDLDCIPIVPTDRGLYIVRAFPHQSSKKLALDGVAIFPVFSHQLRPIRFRNRAYPNGSNGTRACTKILPSLGRLVTSLPGSYNLSSGFNLPGLWEQRWSKMSTLKVKASAPGLVIWPRSYVGAQHRAAGNQFDGRYCDNIVTSMTL
jgi:hypothetical protein